MKVTGRLDQGGPVMKVCEKITFFNSRYSKGESLQLKLERYAKVLCKKVGLDLGLVWTESVTVEIKLGVFKFLRFEERFRKATFS